MTILQSIILGLIEGITEFLPVSSTAHLIVGQRILGIETVNEFFTTIVQLGAIAALIVAERKRLVQIGKEFFSSLATSRQSLVATQAFQLALASLPVLLVGFVIKDSISSVQNNIGLIAFMSIAIGFVLFLAEKYSKKAALSSKLPATSSQLFFMGLFQVVSLIPGTSRSGITAAGGAFQKMSLSQALEYSFLLSIPALLAAGGYEVLKAVRHPLEPGILLPTVIGTVVAFIAAMISIEWLRKVVRQRGFFPFVIYRFIFAIAILLL